MSDTADCALITGAHTGTGAARARAPAARSVGVVLAERRADRRRKLHQRIAGPAVVLTAGLACFKDWTRLQTPVGDRHQAEGACPSHLVQTAGVGTPIPCFAPAVLVP